jgi:hypothetical protein
MHRGAPFGITRSPTLGTLSFSMPTVSRRSASGATPVDLKLRHYPAALKQTRVDITRYNKK